MILHLDGSHLVFLMKHHFPHWHLEKMDWFLQLEPVMAGWDFMMSVENHSLTQFFVLIAALRWVLSRSDSGENS